MRLQTFRERLAAESRLPERYRGRQGAAALLADVPLRVAVAGVDGTAELARMLRDALARRGRRVAAVSPARTAARAASPRRACGSIVRQVTASWPVDCLVLETATEGERRFDAAAAGAIHRGAQVQAVLLTTLARDPVDGAWSPRPERTRALAASVPERATLVCGERDAATREALQEGLREAGAFFVDAAPRGADAPPGAERVLLVDRLLRLRTGAGLTAAERVACMARLQRGLQWSPSALPGVRWHDGTRLAPLALRATLDHLVRRWPARVHALAHFGEGRTAQAERLAPVLGRAFDDGVLAHLHVGGRGAHPLVRALSSAHPVTVLGHRSSSLPAALRVLRREAHAGAIVAVGDAGAPWMRQAISRLAAPGAAPGRWAPWRLAASDDTDLPPPIASMPRPPAPAPPFGRRSRASILGDPDVPPAPRRPRPIRPLPGRPPQAALTRRAPPG